MPNKVGRSGFRLGIAKYSRTSSDMSTGDTKDYVMKKHLHYYYPSRNGADEISGVARFSSDITESRKREAILHRLNRTLMALNNINHALLHADDELTYMKEVCRIIREDCGYAMVWIGFTDSNESKSVRPVASDGFEEGYLETLKNTWADTECGRSVTGTAILTRKPCVCLNMLTDSRFRPWRKEAKKLGYASSISFPLISGDRAFGALTIYSSKPDSFQEDEMKLLSELSADLANGITTLRLRVAHAQAEETSIRAKEYWERTFDAVPDMIAIIDADFHILQANKAMVDRFGLTLHSCIGQICYKMIHGTDCPPSFCPHRKTMTDGLEHTVEVKEKLLDGDFTISTSPLLEHGGGMIGSVHVIRDITRYKQAEMALTDQAAKLQEHTAQLETINRELESFSYSVSHDLRAPLRAIDGYSRMILRDQTDKLDDEAKRKFNLIRSNAQMMDKLIDDLLSFSRLGRMEINMTRLYMEDLINDVWKEIQIINPDRKLTLKINNINPRSWGDRSLIRQVYSNLLSNAVKYTKFSENADIETGSYPQDNEDVYYVKDKGVGFDMGYHDKLFGVFQRLHSADEYEGTGVGLAIVQRIIHRHGGRVWAEGEEGKGATFYFTLLRRD